MEETFVLSDASTEDAISDALVSLSLPGVSYVIDWAMDYPGQQLAIDVYADSQDELAHALSLIRSVLRERLDIEARLSSELDHEIALAASI